MEEDILSNLISGHPLEAGSDTNLCSLIISSHIGLKQAYCRESFFGCLIGYQLPFSSLIIAHPHIQGGRSDDRLPIINHPWSGTTYSSSEGEYDYSKSIYGNWSDIDIISDVTMNDESGCRDLILPIPRIPTSSPDSPHAQPRFADTVVPTSKRPRAPVAADLDTANILPLEHRRKRMKPVRVRNSESDTEY